MSSPGGTTVRHVLLLEDEDDRIERLRSVIASVDCSLQLKVWHSEHSMIREVETFLPSACLISLDHDLFPRPGQTEDPGDGLAVAKFLAARRPVCPVIVHSSNSRRALYMIGEFELAGWTFERVAPIGEDWIEHDWAMVARDLLRDSTDRS